MAETTEAHQRRLTLVGVAIVACVCVVGMLIAVNPFAGRSTGLISITINAPDIGQGVIEGTDVVMHGVAVGEVAAVSILGGGDVRLNLDLQKDPIAELTDSMQIDFRPTNYFGVTGVNLIPRTGGQALRDGTEITTVPKGNFTIQALLYRLGEVSTGTLTQRLVDVIDRATRYTDAFDPLIETVLISADAVAQVQTVSTERLLANATGLSVVFPSAVDALMDTGWNFIHDDTNWVHKAHADYTDDEWQNLFIATDDEASGALFATIGKLESSDAYDLRPLIDTFNSVFAVVPPLIRPEGFAQMLKELRTRFEKMYGGTPDQRALQVQLILDNLPGVAAPVNTMGGP
jgi:hypothetical protein